MEKLIDVDWRTMFVPSSSILEIIIRGSLTYWFVFLYIRFVRRSSGQLNVTDILLITLISDASQNAMAGSYESVTEGVALVGTLVGWDYVINWLGFRSVFFDRLGNPEPVLLIKNGVLQRDNLKRHLITEDEFMGLLREEGIETIDEVKQCYLEGSGNLSVIPKEKK
ncbi:DUF421 domain-containing protein [Fibrella sp. HMF5335]|uniref:DUF421 domain-containing protein n=1 Tax=Fibrella rubiginis TaxID=2817060 RepID=A0A939GN81_9BACT|nr:YetF domain-containing protein [Fibrella rubiginis]MBO0939915.1 DUF421 domain-containing protein [Fibrella rubiginis]